MLTEPAARRPDLAEQPSPLDLLEEGVAAQHELSPAPHRRHPVGRRAAEQCVHEVGGGGGEPHAARRGAAAAEDGLVQLERREALDVRRVALGSGKGSGLGVRVRVRARG